MTRRYSRMRLVLLGALALAGSPALAGPSGMQEYATGVGEPATGVSVYARQTAVAESAEQEHGVGEAAEPSEEHAEKPWWDLPARLTNFALLLGLLYWLLVVPPPFVVQNFDFPGLRIVLAERSGAILAARQLAVEETSSAARLEAESAQRLERVQEEAAVLVQEARAAAARERQRMEADAEAEAERIGEGASRDLNAELGRARRALQVHAADLAVGMARRLVEDNLTAADQERLIHQYVERLGSTAS